MSGLERGPWAVPVRSVYFSFCYFFIFLIFLVGFVIMMLMEEIIINSDLFPHGLPMWYLFLV